MRRKLQSHVLAGRYRTEDRSELRTAPTPFSPTQQLRYASNLAFFDAFSSLTRSSADVQTRLRDSHVLVLGAGGLGSAVLMNLAGLGIGTLTVADQDQVELRNFARQFTYRPSDIGAPKADRVADWLRAFDPGLTVHSTQQRIENPQHVSDLLRAFGQVDFVVSAIDEPDEIDRWVNQACVPAGVPFVRGGLAHTQGLYWSVDPGRSACRECLEIHRSRLANGIDKKAVSWPRVIRRSGSTGRLARWPACSGHCWPWRPCGISPASPRLSLPADISWWTSPPMAG